MTDGAKIKTSIYLPSELHWRLKEEAVKRRLSDTAAMQEAITGWVDKAQSSVSIEDAALVRAFLALLHSGKESDIREVKNVLSGYPEVNIAEVAASLKSSKATKKEAKAS